MAAREVFLSEHNPPPRSDVPEDVRERLAEHRKRLEKREREHDDPYKTIESQPSEQKPKPDREGESEESSLRAHERKLTRKLAHKRELAQEQSKRQQDTRRDETSDDIRDDINLIRARMDKTIDTLQLRLTPQYMAQQTMDKIKHRSTRAGNRFTNLVRENPVPAILSGLGLTWLVGAGMRGKSSEQGQYSHEPATAYDAELRARRRLYEAGMESQGSAYPPPSEYEYGQAGESGTGAGRSKASEYGEQARGKAGEMGQHASESIQHASQTARERTSEFSQRASEAASHMGHQMREQAGKAGEQFRTGTQQAGEKARDLFDQHPLSVGLGVMAAGLALGLLLPTTRKEDEMFGTQRDRLFDRAKEYGEDLAERGQAVAQRATEAAKEAASEEGLSPEQASEEGEDIARRAGDVAAEAGEAARDEAKQQGLAGDESESQRRTGGEGQA